MITDYRGKRVTVMGLGRFGGGVGVAQFLAQHGARVTITDLRSEEELSDSLAALDDCPLAGVHLDRHHEEDFTSADLIVASPAIPSENHFLQIARTAGVAVSSEMNLFWKHNRGQTIAVTGSNGKSTTTALTHGLLKAGGVRSHLGGNIGISLLPIVEEIDVSDYVVLELSSFQLQALASERPQPDVAIVTNLSPNHLDRHRTMAAYRRAKQSLLNWQHSEQLAILNGEDNDVSSWPTRCRRMIFSESDTGEQGIFREGEGVVFRDEHNEISLPLGDWLTLPGKHNFQNAMAATCSALACGISPSAIERGLREFQPLPHRLQCVGEAEGRRFFNDSIATTPESVAAALESFSEPIVLLAGGYDKEIDLSEFARLIGKRCKAIALIGQTAPSLAESLKKDSSAVFRCCSSLEEAFNWGVEQSAAGDVVLLSPGCASYDWFGDFRERGAVFSALVQAMSVCKASGNMKKM